MATTDRPSGTATGASDIAATCAEAGFLHLVVRADGDALAAAGILVAACDRQGTPFHVRVARTEAAAETQLAGADDAATTLALGLASADPVSLTAYHAAADLGTSPDPMLAIAGAVAGGTVTSTIDDRLLGKAGLDRRPGIAAPVDGHADGLAFTTYAHAPFSGDPEAAAEPLEDLDEANGRSVASLLAMASVGPDDTPARAGVAIERALRPYVGGPFRTAGGYADVLNALAREAPGVGIALALNGDGHDEAVAIWKNRSERVHEALRNAGTARYDGLVVARVDGPVEPVARLLRDFRSPEPVVLAVADGEAGVAAYDQAIGGPLATAAEAADGSALSRGTRGFARFHAEREEAFIEGFREALA